MRRHKIFICLSLAGLLALGGCSSGSSSSGALLGDGDGDAGNGGGEDQVAAQAMDVTIPSPTPRADGTTPVNISMTVFIPAHNPGDTYPLIVHSHGFGGSRVGIEEAMADPAEPDPIDSTRSIFSRIDDQVRLLWDAGYAVISFDERGFGRGDDGDMGNDGEAEIISPDFEIVDAIAVLDWAEVNLPDLARDDNGDLLVGTIGGSYGGGYQLLLAALDPRVDAIVPAATWYNLLQSLLPNDVIKKAYSTGLCLLAQTDMAELGQLATSACAQAAEVPVPASATARYQEDIRLMNQELQDFFFTHGLVDFERRQDAGMFMMRPVDALLLQGNRDILFNLNQAVDNYQFLNPIDGADVRLLTLENGHSIAATRMLGGSQGPLGPSACGQLDGLAALRAWFDLKLRGNAGAETNLPPEVCLSLDDGSGVFLDSVPVADVGNAQFDPFEIAIPDTMVTAMANNSQSATGQAVFIPLGNPIQTAGQVLAGVPVANVTIDDTAPDPRGGTTAFIGIGINRGGSIILVDDQVQPLRAADPRTGASPMPVELIGVGEQLQLGDELGVLLYGSFDQYEPGLGLPANFSLTNNYTISGSIRLPVVTAVVQSR